MKFSLCTLSIIILFNQLSSNLVQAQQFPVDVVNALENKFGVHKGQRRNHTKGLCFAAEFTGNKAMQQYSESQLFSGNKVNVIGRFSHAGGYAAISDNAVNTHGMALRFILPHSELHQMAMLNLPFFDVATPQGFLAKQLATVKDPQTGKPDPAKVAAFKAQYPEVKKLEAALKGQDRVPDGYEHDAYNSIHAFYLTNNQQQTAARWSFIPDLGIKKLSHSELTKKDSEFLTAHLKQSLKQRKVSWHMQVTLANPGDALTDPTEQWAGLHQQIDAGTLTLTSLNAECESINYDPLLLSKGFLPTQDPVLLARSPAYAVSFGRRLTETAQHK
ncbi:catalase family peroxidase [Neptunicella marina]|uniref:Catalase-related peroxidase n=1 Tax=Neptunicella marina TaxID=2125989 RepID=A0A8J6IXQ0_9ALTE|nr:catalase family peroxidase [Neptunicella marina]MBC3767824.1 catalase family peroxidase [Neptunicella marina]